MAEQLGAGGVLEAVKVSRLGYANRFSCSEFIKKYGCLVKTNPKPDKDPKERAKRLIFDVINHGKGYDGNDEKDLCEGLNNEHMEKFGYQLGRTMVFMKREAFENIENRLAEKVRPSEERSDELAATILTTIIARAWTSVQHARPFPIAHHHRNPFRDSLRSSQLEEASITLQKYSRGSSQRKAYLKALFVILRIQCALRRKVAVTRANIIRRNNASTVLQAAFRMHASVARFKATLALAAIIQRVLRGRKERKLFIVILRASKATKLQSYYRSAKRRRAFTSLRSAVVSLQCARRRRVAKLTLKELKIEQRSVAAIKKERDKLRQEAAKMKEELERAKMLLLQEQDAARRAIEDASNASIGRKEASRHEAPPHPDSLPPPETNLPVPPANPVIPTLIQKTLQEKDREILELKREMGRLRAASSAAPKGRSPPLPSHALASPSTPAFTTPDEKLREEAEILHRKNEELELQIERMARTTMSPKREAPGEALQFNSPARPITMDRNPVSTPIQSYYASAAKSKKQSALHFAVLQHDEDAVRSMLDEEIPVYISSNSPLDVNSVDSDFRTPLHCAALNGSAKIVEMLLDKRAVPNLSDRNGDTALHLLTDLDCARLLLRKGSANPNIPNQNGYSALHNASRRGDMTVVEELLKHGADPNAVCDKNWRSPIFDTAIQGHVGLLKLFIDHTGENLELNQRDKYGYTPLHHVASLSHNDCVVLASTMLEAGADPNVIDKVRRSEGREERSDDRILHSTKTNNLPLVVSLIAAWIHTSSPAYEQ